MDGIGQFANAIGQHSPFNKAVNFGFSQLGNHLDAQRRESAFTDYGLPRYAAYMGSGPNSLPQQRVQLAGNNFESVGPVGAKFALGANQHMRRFGIGSSRLPPSNQPPGMSRSSSSSSLSSLDSSPPPYDQQYSNKESAADHWWPNGPPNSQST